MKQANRTTDIPADRYELRAAIVDRAMTDSAWAAGLLAVVLDPTSKTAAEARVRMVAKAYPDIDSARQLADLCGASRHTVADLGLTTKRDETGGAETRQGGAETRQQVARKRASKWRGNAPPVAGAPGSLSKKDQVEPTRDAVASPAADASEWRTQGTLWQTESTTESGGKRKLYEETGLEERQFWGVVADVHKARQAIGLDPGLDPNSKGNGWYRLAAGVSGCLRDGLTPDDVTAYAPEVATVTMAALRHEMARHVAEARTGGRRHVARDDPASRAESSALAAGWDKAAALARLDAEGG